MLERNKTRQKTAGSVRTRRTGMPFLYFIAAGILSCAQITGVGSPFGVAFAAAACRTGYGFGAVLGTFAGYLLSHPGAEGVQYAGAALIVLAASTVFSGTGITTGRWFYPVGAAVSVAATSCIFVFADGWEWQKAVLFVCQLILAGGAAYFYEAAIDTVRGRPQKIRFGGIMVLCATVLMAAYPLQVIDLICPARIAALLIVMGTGYMGGPNDTSTTVTMYIMRLHTTDTGRAAAVSVLLFICTLIISLIFFATMRNKDNGSGPVKGGK